MNYHRFKRKVFVPLLVLPTVLGAGSVFAQEQQQGEQGAAANVQQQEVDTSVLNEAAAIAESAFESARESQTRINQLSDQADELMAEYRELSKIVDGLEVYNAGMRRTIAEQERTIAQYDASIAEAAELQRQIPPLMERMMVALEQFVELDLPFRLERRQEDLETIRDTFDDSGVNIAEKFRLVLTAYQAESNYGRSMNTYTDTLPINGVERDVDILRVGRIALLYQTSDQTATGLWNNETRQWEPLDDSYTRPVRNAIRMAQQLTSTEIIELPIEAPESAQ